FVGDGFVRGECWDESLDGDVVDGSGQPAGAFVDERCGVIGKERVGPPGEGEVVSQVAAGLVEGHPGQVRFDRDALVERGEHAELEHVPQGGLADEQAGEGGGGVDVEVGQHAQGLELVGGQQVGFVEDQDGDTASFGVFGGEGLGGLWEQGAGVEAGRVAQAGGDLLVEASGADVRVRHVDGVVARRVQPAEGGAYGHGLSAADLAGDHAQGPGGDGPGDAGDGLGVAAVAVQHAHGEVAAERQAGEA